MYTVPVLLWIQPGAEYGKKAANKEVCWKLNIADFIYVHNFPFCIHIHCNTIVEEKISQKSRFTCIFHVFAAETSE